MEEGDFVNTCSIDLRFPKWDLSVLGGLQNTHRMLLKMIHANYDFDQDTQLILFYKRGQNDTEEMIPYTLVKENNYFKVKLPPGILVREWRLQLIGTDLEASTILEIGTNWIAHPVGKR